MLGPEQAQSGNALDRLSHSPMKLARPRPLPVPAAPQGAFAARSLSPRRRTLSSDADTLRPLHEGIKSDRRPSASDRRPSASVPIAAGARRPAVFLAMPHQPITA